MLIPGTTQNVQRVVCMLLSVVVVAVSFSFGLHTPQQEAHHGYSVTVTQLQ